MKFIPFHKPYITKKIKKSVNMVLSSGFLTTGKMTQLFEKKVAELIDVKYAFAVNSATSGLLLSLEAAKAIKPDQFVITSPYTFAATANVIEQLGGYVHFVDIEKDTYNIDYRLVLEEAYSSKRKISAILPVDIAGLRCDIDKIEEFSVPVIEDAAHLFPITHRNLSSNLHADAVVFSFYATKPITTGEGGMVVTNSDILAKRIKTLRMHGIDSDIWNRYSSNKPKWQYDVIAPGYKYNLPDVLSVIGLSQLEELDYMTNRRKEIAKIYIEELEDCEFIELPMNIEQYYWYTDHIWHLFIIKVDSRDEFIEYMAENKIGTSVHFIPLHIMSYYKKKYDFKPNDFPVAYNNYLKSVSLPIYPSLTNRELNYIIDTIKRWKTKLTITF